MAKTLLLGLDSMTFRVLDDLVGEGRLPFFERCLSEGVRADLISTPNPLTPPGWTSMITGQGPGVHGVYDFMHWSEHEHGPWGRLVTSNEVRCETIASMADRHGMRGIWLNFPLMFPAPRIKGFVVPGYITARQLRTSIYPRSLYDRIRALPDFDPKEFSWNMEENRRAVDGLPAEEYERWIGYYITKDRHWFHVARMLITEEAWDLAAIVFEGVDRLQHLVWRFLDPALKDTLSSDWERRIRDLALDYFVQIDAQLAELMAIAGPETRVIIASDHGAGPSTEIFFPNVLLSKLGYLKWKNQGPTVPDDQLTAPYIFDFYKSIDWPATTAYLRSSSANGIYIRRAERGWGGVTEADYAAFREKLIGDLLGYIDPRDGKPIITRVMTREEAYPGPAMEDAPDITLFLRDGGHPAVLNSNEIVRSRHEVSGMHRHEGVFIALGPGLRHGLSLPPRGIADVTPTMLYCLGLPIPEGLDGNFVREAFEKDQLAAEPVRYEHVDAQAEKRSQSPEESMNAEDEATVLERLRQLGYMD